MSNILIDGKFYAITGKGKKRRDGKTIYECRVQYTKESTHVCYLTLENFTFKRAV
jgi:hypothetical protein